MPDSVPSAQVQLAFLTKLQRLFVEGDFTATYKFALLIALADLAVELGADDGAPLRLTVRQIAECFVQQYWRHAVPYSAGQTTSAGVLVQNQGAQAAVLTAIAAFRATCVAMTLQQARAQAGYEQLLSRVAAVVSAKPLNHLQNFSGTNDPFLYERPQPGVVMLKPAVAYCLRRFYPLVQQLARQHWVGHIKANRRNQTILGEAHDLESFLFGPSRQSLAMMGAGLRQLDGMQCFYCGQRLQQADVDHFIPFALYPRDLAHNFVLAHPQCNRSKSASLASKGHLERWLERLVSKAAQLGEIGLQAGLVVDAHTAHRVAAWGYVNAHAAQGRAWVRAAEYEPIGADYLVPFTADTLTPEPVR